MSLLKNLHFHYVYVQYLEGRLIYYIAQSLLEMGQRILTLLCWKVGLLQAVYFTVHSSTKVLWSSTCWFCKGSELLHRRYADCCTEKRGLETRLLKSRISTSTRWTEKRFGGKCLQLGQMWQVDLAAGQYLLSPFFGRNSFITTGFWRKNRLQRK
jgi:hypothetical protein